MIRSFITSILTVSFAVAQAQAPFEGVVKFKGENKTFSETSELSWYVKNGNSKLDFKSYTKEANAEYSMYFVQGQPAVQLTADDGNGNKVIYDVPYSSFSDTEYSTAFSAEPTGKKATFAGYECEEYIVKTANTQVSCWVSKSTGINPSVFPSVILGRGIFSVLQRNGIQGIPLKITSRDFAGNVITDQEVVSIQASSVPDQTFVIPAGYQKANK